MNCIVCGHKLAIFRKLSLGDFCSQEHRDHYFKEAHTESKYSDGGTRVYAQFLQDEPRALSAAGAYRGYGPLSAVRVVAPDPTCRLFSRLAPARPMTLAGPQRGVGVPIGHEAATLRMKLPGAQLLFGDGGMRLRPAGLILPWSGETGSQKTFSLAPLVAAAWAQSGYSKPMAAPGRLAGALQFAWPTFEAKLEAPAPASIGAATFATVETPAMRPMRVRLNVPSVARHKPELAMPAPALEYIAPEADEIHFVSPAPEPPPRKAGFFETLLAPRPQRTASRPVKKRREEIFDYNEPAPVVKTPSGRAWAAMLSEFAPSAGVASAMFAVVFLFSALAIFFSAPSALSQRAPSWRWSYLRSAIRDRAVMRVEDDFRAGLNRWTIPSGVLKDWSYDNGFLRPGKLGFLQDSMNLVNYRMELMGQIERKSLGWAFRARDERNYYVAKLTIARPGPLPMVDLVRYAVTDGKEGGKVRVPLPFSVRNDTLYQVEMNVRGDQFRASVNGHVVDSWSDKRLMAGGVGFVSGQGEASRVRWIRVSDKDDVLGRICSYLSARADLPFDGSLSASYYPFLLSPGGPLEF